VKIIRPRSGQTEFAIPPVLVREVRPCLVYFTEMIDNSPCQLSFYVRYGDNRSDQWIVVNPYVGQGEEQLRAEESVSLWRAYLEGVFVNWRIGAGPNDDVFSVEKPSNWEEEK
jgi:hypothetical protein